MSEPQKQKVGRRQFLRTIGAVGALGSYGSASFLNDACATPTPAIDAPNIVFFFSDQQRWDTLGCYGQKLPLTPNLDQMAAEGVRFENAFTCQPVCGPARSCLQTGKYATETGCYRNGIRLPVDEKTIAHWLSEAGYEVGYLGKWHLASDRDGGEEENYRIKPIPPKLRAGYKDFWLASDILEFTSHSYDGHMFDDQMQQVDFPQGRYRVDAQTDFAIDYLQTRDRRRPFFLFLSYIEPHHQNDHGHFEGPEGSKERWKDYEVPGDLVDTQGDWRREMPDYLGCIHSLDENLGRIREELSRLGMADNTLILYTTDHACHFRTRNSEYKRSCHDNSIRIPMLAVGPGFQGGQVVEELVSLIDIPPTILKAASVDTPDSMQGRPLQEPALGQVDDWPEEVFVQISEAQTGRAIRTSRWKYSVVAPKQNRGSSDLYTEDCLYDLEADPHERNNLVADAAHADVRKTLAQRLKERMLAAGEESPTIRAAETDDS